jgi:hypothetical protein
VDVRSVRLFPVPVGDSTYSSAAVQLTRVSGDGRLRFSFAQLLRILFALDRPGSGIVLDMEKGTHRE